MGDILIWLSGANRKILAECPTERPKYFGIGAAILVTGAMAAVSLSFALVNALKITLGDAIVFAALWGLAILMLDRLFVVSMHRQRGRFSFLIYLVQAVPRLLMSVVLGFVISTPFVLQIFKPEITDQIQKQQAAAREAYFKDLPKNPVYLAVQTDKTKLDQLTTQASTGGSPVNPARNPEIISLQAQLSTGETNETYWMEQLNCQLYGTSTTGGKCVQGYGPLGHDDQVEYSYWENQVTIIRGDIHTQTQKLEQANQNAQNANKTEAQGELANARQELAAAQSLLTLQTDDVTAGIKQDKGILTQLQALSAVTAGNSTLQWARLLLFLLFVMIDIMPVFIKLLTNLVPAGNYDKMLAEEESSHLRVAENHRALREASQRMAAQAEVTGVRYRNVAMAADLTGMHDAIIASRLKVEKEWLRRREAEQMRNAMGGEGITGIGAPHADGWQGGWQGGWPTGGRGTGSWPGRQDRASLRGKKGAPMPATGPSAGRWSADQAIPGDPGQPRAGQGQDSSAGSRWGWLGSLAVPRPRQRRSGQGPARPAPWQYGREAVRRENGVHPAQFGQTTAAGGPVPASPDASGNSRWEWLRAFRLLGPPVPRQQGRGPTPIRRPGPEPAVEMPDWQGTEPTAEFSSQPTDPAIVRPYATTREDFLTPPAPSNPGIVTTPHDFVSAIPGEQNGVRPAETLPGFGPTPSLDLPDEDAGDAAGIWEPGD